MNAVLKFLRFLDFVIKTSPQIGTVRYSYIPHKSKGKYGVVNKAADT
jgi:hypothetical protein